MKILVIDGQGGKMGRQITEALTSKYPEADITAVGTNSAATQSMIKGGAGKAATGENAVIVGSRNADIIIGPLGVVIADSMHGEITPAMALATAQSNAVKILIPANKCSNLVAGIGDISMSVLIADALAKIDNVIKGDI